MFTHLVTGEKLETCLTNVGLIYDKESNSYNLKEKKN